MGQHRITPHQTSFHKAAVRVATTTSVNLASPPSSVDGVALSAGDRILVRAQSTPAQNGVYVHGATWTRATDCNTALDFAEGTTVSVIAGTTLAGTRFRFFPAATTFVVGVTAVSIVQDTSESLTLLFGSGGRQPSNAFLIDDAASIQVAMLASGVTHFTMSSDQPGTLEPLSSADGGADPTDIWTLSGGALTIEAVGTEVGTGYALSAQASRRGRGAYYAEVVCVAVTGADIHIGIIGRTDAINADVLLGVDIPGVGYHPDGAVSVMGVSQAGSWDSLADGDILGIYLDFANPDDPTQDGAGDWEARAYFSINGVWQGGGDPETNANPVVFSTDFATDWVLGASVLAAATGPELRFIPAGPYTYAPGLGETGFTIAQGSAGDYLACPSISLASPEDFEFTSSTQYSPLGIGRSIQVTTDAAYDGGDLSITVLRSDTGEEETRTIEVADGGGTVYLDIPIQAVLACSNLGTYTAGTFAVQRGPLWSPIGAPASDRGGVLRPAPIAANPAPTMVNMDTNVGVLVETPDIAGEDLNMLDLRTLSRPPSPSGERYCLQYKVYFRTLTAP